MNRYCTKCGNPLNENDHFCSKCGTECKVVNSNVSPSIQSGNKKTHNLWRNFKSLPIWVKLSYIFAAASFILLFTYCLTYSHHFDYYISTKFVEGHVKCYDDWHIIERCGYHVSYVDAKEIMDEIEDAEYWAQLRLDSDFESVIWQIIITVFSIFLINTIIVKILKRPIINKYRQSFYIFIVFLNILSPFILIAFNQHIEYMHNYERVTRSFLYDIPSVIKYANEHGIDTSREFRDLKNSNARKTENNNYSTNNNGAHESGKFVYYEDAGVAPNNSSSSSYNSYEQEYDHGTSNTEYKEPCGLCGGDGKCYNARARSLAEMEMYCNGTGSCPQCHGKTYVNNSYEGIDSPMKCTYCNGTGICPKCHGTKVCNACHGRRH